MKLVITGASGFLGRNFLLGAPPDWQIAALYRNDASFPGFVASLGKPNVIAIRCDLQSPEDVAAFVDRHGADWDCCAYFAAKVDIPWSVREPAADLTCNTLPLLNLLDRIRVDRMIYFSSGAVYEGSSGEVHPDVPIKPNLPYAVSKQACERYVEFFRYRRKSVGRFLIVRFFGAYGPYEAPHKIYTRLIRAFAFENQDRYKVYGDGTNLIDAMYADDAVEAIRRMIGGSYWDAVVNLAGGNPITIESLVRQAGKAIGPGDITVEREGVAHESNQFWGSASEMIEHYGFRPTVPLAEGLQRFRDFARREWTER